ncbi:hypothetical protein [Mucilaginibacter xinganensis]|uniref:Uncharacterized protein n=1 Tax=Mucilaginibacter xinganensis TaxID=1234841 RepID=A0A223NS62_9SPHI|nr:hypothetical protein [Mucilaginibacter xinganensis]ASU32498.1 hypothetical protein MuYL_0595 [Mucilaginibacter xinganensis]
MKIIPKLILPALLIGLLFNSCKKNDSGSSPGMAMKFNCNGKAISFNSCYAEATTVGNTSEVMITGVNITNSKHGTTSFEVALTHDFNTLKSGQTYPIGRSISQVDAATLFYFTTATNVFNTQPGNTEGTVTVTEVTSATVKGTFSGKLFAEDDLEGQSMVYTITNGEFTAKK